MITEGKYDGRRGTEVIARVKTVVMAGAMKPASTAIKWCEALLVVGDTA